MQALHPVAGYQKWAVTVVLLKGAGRSSVAKTSWRTCKKPKAQDVFC